MFRDGEEGGLGGRGDAGSGGYGFGGGGGREGVGVGRERSQTWGEGGWLWERVESENVCELSVALWAVMFQKGDLCRVLGRKPGVSPVNRHEGPRCDTHGDTYVDGLVELEKHRFGGGEM